MSRCSAPTIHSGLNAISYLCVAKLSKLPEARLASPQMPAAVHSRAIWIGLRVRVRVRVRVPRSCAVGE